MMWVVPLPSTGLTTFQVIETLRKLYDIVCDPTPSRVHWEQYSILPGPVIFSDRDLGHQLATQRHEGGF